MAAFPNPYVTPYTRANVYEFRRGYTAVNPHYGQSSVAVPGAGNGTLVATLAIVGGHPRIIVQHVPPPVGP